MPGRKLLKRSHKYNLIEPGHKNNNNDNEEKVSFKLNFELFESSEKINS